ncbi:hypothetical protein [Xanthomonas cannabis]|uniref:hypothetical protein n=1 Tax=Xanthomonas cannabis TaxID=1885674 RepID=UPI0033BDE6D3
MTAPEQLVDLFERPFQPTQTRDATDSERAANLAAGQHISSALTMEVPYGQEIQNSVDAARWAATHHASNALCDHLADKLPTSLGYKRLRSSMPKTTPVPIRNYRQRGASSRTDGFLDAVANNATALALGQVLFHGGAWEPGATPTQLQFPLSTSFCPEMALRNAAWGGKAWASGYVNLLHIRVSSHDVRGFVCSLRSTKGHENEVILAQGTLLTAMAAEEISPIYVGSMDGSSKMVPVRLVFVEAV